MGSWFHSEPDKPRLRATTPRDSKEQNPGNSYSARTERTVREAPPGQRVFYRWLGIPLSALSSFARIRVPSRAKIPPSSSRLCGLRASAPGREILKSPSPLARSQNLAQDAEAAKQRQALLSATAWATRFFAHPGSRSEFWFPEEPEGLGMRLGPGR